MDFTIKKNDTRTAFKATLYNPKGSKVDLTGATVKLILSDLINKVIIDATIQDTLNGVILVTFAESTLSVFDGWVKGEVKATFNDGKTETYPNDGYLKILVTKNL